MKKIALTIYSKPDCSLCGPFSDVVKKVAAKIPWREHVELNHVNILQDEVAFEKYHEKIPVLTINGDLAFKYFITEEELEKRLDDLRILVSPKDKY